MEAEFLSEAEVPFYKKASKNNPWWLVWRLLLLVYQNLHPFLVENGLTQFLT